MNRKYLSAGIDKVSVSSILCKSGNKNRQVIKKIIIFSTTAWQICFSINEFTFVELCKNHRWIWINTELSFQFTGLEAQLQWQTYCGSLLSEMGIDFCITGFRYIISRTRSRKGQDIQPTSATESTCMQWESRKIMYK